MSGDVQIPPGVSLLLIGSGLYWILSSQLISSFTVLMPGLFETAKAGETLIMVVGIFAMTAGLWIVGRDIEEFRRITAEIDGHVFTLPLMLATIDLYSTMINLSIDPQAVELNPLVSSAIQYGFVAIVPFLVSYMVLSQGLALLMLSLGRSLFGKSSPAGLVPFAFVCAASSFGPFSNLIGMAVGYATAAADLLAAVGSTTLAFSIFKIQRNAIPLNNLISK